MVYRLHSPVDANVDHILGSEDAAATLVEYGSYACERCRAANEPIAAVREQVGERMRYVFRHFPLRGNDLAQRAAELVECAPTSEAFWQAHMRLMSRSAQLTEADLTAVADELGLTRLSPDELAARRARAKERVAADERSAHEAHVIVTPTFFINDRPYRGAWDEMSLSDAILGSLGYRVRVAALDFARWAPSAGVLLLLATILAIVLANSRFATAFEQLLATDAGVTFGNASFRLALR
ncbi:MAG TPA: DsbA family protein, partial [Steroidobacter sp.]|nr:DsbA family protein [Steroidobacter sp.]